MSLHSRSSRSRCSTRSSSQSSVHTPGLSPSQPASTREPLELHNPKPSTARYVSPTNAGDSSPTIGSGGFDKKLNKMLARVCHTSGGSVRSEFEQQLYHEMSMFVSSGASQCFHVSCRYDRSLTGTIPEEDKFNGVCMIHEYYSAQQNIAEKGNGGEFTFAEVMAANATLSVAEFSKVTV